MYDQANWRVRDIDFTEDYIRVTKKHGLPKSMKSEMDSKDPDYHSLPHKKCCDPLSTFKAKDKRKRSADQIKIYVSQ